MGGISCSVLETTHGKQARLAVAVPVHIAAAVVHAPAVGASLESGVPLAEAKRQFGLP